MNLLLILKRLINLSQEEPKQIFHDFFSQKKIKSIYTINMSGFRELIIYGLDHKISWF